MNFEIERKFLVKNKKYRELADPVLYRQGFLSTNKRRVVRIRTVDNKAWLTVKSKVKNNVRKEFEYEIPFDDAQIMLNKVCKKPTIAKYRYKIELGGLTWEVDEFLTENKGLIIAEVELPTKEFPLEIPSWVGDEVSHDPKYYNSNLTKKPFSTW